MSPCRIVALDGYLDYGVTEAMTPCNYRARLGTQTMIMWTIVPPTPFDPDWAPPSDSANDSSFFASNDAQRVSRSILQMLRGAGDPARRGPYLW